MFTKLVITIASLISCSAYAGFSFESRCADTKGNLYSVAYHTCHESDNCSETPEVLTCLNQSGPCALKTGTALEGHFIDRINSDGLDSGFGIGKAFAQVDKLLSGNLKGASQTLFAFDKEVVLCSDRQRPDDWKN